jgi:hypothetical protein
MSMRGRALGDGTDPGFADTSDGGGAPDDRPLVPVIGGGDSGPSLFPGAPPPPPGGSDGGSGPPPAWAAPGVGALYDPDRNLPPATAVDVGAGGAPLGNPSTNPGGGLWSDPPGSDAKGDPLAALVDGLRGLTSDWGIGGASCAGPSATLLSNGLNADAGVAQLVSALASVHDGNSAFDATPFAAPSDPGVHGIVAPASQ